MSEKEFYSVKEVAQILGLPPDRIYEYLRAGYISGARLTPRSAWRIPITELERLADSGASGFGTRMETKQGGWANMLDMVTQLKDSLPHISPKDWAIWGLPDTGQPPLTSQAGLSIWVDRGKL